MCNSTHGTGSLNISQMCRKFLTQPSRYKGAESNLLADEKIFYHLGQVFVFIYIYLMVINRIKKERINFVKLQN